MNIEQIFQLFPTEKDCIAHLERVRWNGEPLCPYCKSLNSTALPTEMRHHCNNCNTSYSVTVGTVFHHTHLPLQKWFLAIKLILNARRVISSRQLARDLEVNKNTAWSMQIRIHRAITEHAELICRIVEMNDPHIGGKLPKGNERNDNLEGGNVSTHTSGTDQVVGNVQKNAQVTYAIDHVHANTKRVWTILERRIVGYYTRVSTCREIFSLMRSEPQEMLS